MEKKGNMLLYLQWGLALELSGSVVLQWVSGGVDSFYIPAETPYISASTLTPLFLAKHQ